MILFHFDKDGRNLSGVPAFLGRVWAWRPLSDMIFFVNFLKWRCGWKWEYLPSFRSY